MFVMFINNWWIYKDLTEIQRSYLLNVLTGLRGIRRKCFKGVRDQIKRHRSILITLIQLYPFVLHFQRLLFLIPGNSMVYWLKKIKSNYLSSHSNSLIILAVAPRQATTSFHFTFLIGNMKTKTKMLKAILEGKNKPYLG